MFSNYFFLVVQICVHVTRALIPPYSIYCLPLSSFFCPQSLALFGAYLGFRGCLHLSLGERQRLKEVNAGTITTGGGF